ncbi:universal stress protein [Paraburkholderia azotifigens]|uniref:Universal stress protein n=1 Tax=Paraburkholderia azotifigens TaxID=2057004 RepID=A0ABU9R2Y4_9BURK|nr:universal stress protein [Paraburkholderia azotifigens]
MYKRIFVPYDGTLPSKLALDEAMYIAKLSGGVIEVVSIVEESMSLIALDSGYANQMEPSDSATLSSLSVIEEAGTRIQAAGVQGSVRAVCRDGRDVSEAILLSAVDCDADLVVIGTHCRRGLRRWVHGSIVESLLRRTIFPILIVPCRATA